MKRPLHWAGRSPYNDVEWAVAARPLAGQSECGDSFLVHRRIDGHVLMVVDGAGHGEAAAAAAGKAVVAAARAGEASPDGILRACHAGLADTVGAAASLAITDSRGSTISWCGVGDVYGGLWRPPKTRALRTLLPRPGVLGRRLPSLNVVEMKLQAGDIVVLWTDGIASRAMDELATPHEPSTIVDETVSGRARGTDDALVLAARYVGGVIW